MEDHRKVESDPPETERANSAYEDYREIEEGKSGAVLGYVPFLCFIPLVLMKDNKFAVKHGKQGLLLFLVEILAVVFLFPGISGFFWRMILILCLLTALVGIIHGLQGKDFRIPYFSDFIDQFKI